MTTLLDPMDRAIVTKTLIGVRPLDVPRLRQIHEVALALAERRRIALHAELHSLDRAILMRSEALRQLDALGTR